MANLSSITSRTRLRGVILGMDGTLRAPILGGDNYKRAKGDNLSGTEKSMCAEQLCSSLDSKMISKPAVIHSVKESVDLFRHCLEVSRSTHFGVVRVQTMNYSHSAVKEAHISDRIASKDMVSSKDNQTIGLYAEKNAGGLRKHQIGENVSKKEKINFLVNTLLDLKDSKEAVYSALDAWVAWEQNFPIAALKRVLIMLEKEHQWHRVIQVIKWMLSKGQGTTMGTYLQLIRALDMDHRAEEAHKFWLKKIGTDLHSVPWQLCRLMVSIYYRNNMLEELVKLFKGLEAFDRKPPEKSIVLKVANAYEMLGLLEEKERVLKKYHDLFTEAGSLRKSKKASSKKKKKPEQETHALTTSDDLPSVTDCVQK